MYKVHHLTQVYVINQIFINIVRKSNLKFTYSNYERYIAYVTSYF